MATEDGRFALVTNGEIYNYLELRRELESDGVAFQTQSDTEVLLIALARWGVERTLPRLTGMFAFAFLDTDRRRLTLARDPFGIKPLVWAMRGDDLVFASEPNAILALDGIDRSIHPQAAYDYLRFGLTDRGSATLFQSIANLPPGHFATIDLTAPSAPQTNIYWQPTIGEPSNISLDDAAEELRERFLDNIRLHLRADVPVAAALSGGVDSSAVVAAMRNIVGPGLDLHAFSFVAPGHAEDEQSWASIAGQASGSTMHWVPIGDADLTAEIDSLIRLQGEPFGTTSIFAQNRVYRAVGEAGIKVTVDGQGADEILGGYVPFFSARLADMLRGGRIAAASRLLRGTRDRMGSAALVARAGRHLLPDGLQNMARQAVGEDLVPGWMNSRWLKASAVTPVAPQRRTTEQVLKSELAESLTNRVLPALLRYQDRNSMAYSVESRVPFLTTDLVDFVYSLPDNHLISGDGETKSVFRRAMRGLVPDTILDRRDKIGFVTPQDTWLRTADGWLTSILESDGARRLPVFEHNRMRAIAAAAHSGTGPIPGEIWRWANLIRWANMFDVRFTL